MIVCLGKMIFLFGRGSTSFGIFPQVLPVMDIEYIGRTYKNRTNEVEPRPNERAKTLMLDE
jgi:hypothetical protein